MEHRALGPSGVTVSAVSIGSWLTFDHVDEGRGLEVLAAAIDAGVTFFDDARYDDRTGKAPITTGYSEVVFGELFRKGGWRREDVVIGNKAWLEFYPEESVADETDGSLTRLQMDSIDIMYVVPPPKGVKVADLAAEMSELVASGMVKAWGGLNWSADKISMACSVAEKRGYAPFTAVQLPYNMLYRVAVEGSAMVETCRRTGVSVVASYGLAGGLLTNKYGSGAPRQGSRLTAGELEAQQKRGFLPKVAALAALADELELTPAQLALAYCLVGPNVASVCFGATSREQVEENLGALEAQKKLDDEVLGRIRAIVQSKG